MHDKKQNLSKPHILKLIRRIKNAAWLLVDKTAVHLAGKDEKNSKARGSPNRYVSINIYI